MIRTHRRLLVLSAAFAALAPSAQAADRPRLTSLADAAVASGVPGVVVAVQEGDRRVAVARGRVDRDRRAPMPVTGRFRIGSITKPMTAVVLLRLAERGRLSLDDRVTRWVPGLLPPSARTTVRDLLRHTTGLAEYYDPNVILRPYIDGDLGFRWGARTLVERGVALPTPPRASSGFFYADTNYVLAGLVAEAAGGRPFAALLDAHVVRPLGLRRTSYPLGSRLPRGLVRGYADAGPARTADVSRISPSIAHASGAVVSDARDLIVFLRGLVGGRLLSAGSLREMSAAVSMGSGFSARDRYGLGLWRTDHFGILPRPGGCGASVGHNGVYPGYATYAFSRSDGRRQFVVLISSDALTDRQAAAVIRLVRAAACG